MDVLEILNIDEVNSVMSVQLVLYLTWYDQRIIIQNLKIDENLNTLTSEEQQVQCALTLFTGL